MFQDLPGQILGFVNEEDGLHPSGHFFHQKSVERIDKGFGVICLGIDSELIVYVLQELDCVQFWIEDVG